MGGIVDIITWNNDFRLHGWYRNSVSTHNCSNLSTTDNTSTCRRTK